MIFEASFADDSVTAEIHAVAQAGYAFEAALLGCADFPQLRESLAELRQSPDRFLVFRKDGSIVGVLSFACDSECIRITRLVVSPAHHRQGVAAALLTELERRFAPAPAACFVVSTARDNALAIRLYERFGYAVTSATTSQEGILLVHLTKDGSRAAA